ncbi:MAG: hypothetical protein KZQ95_09485 [Candidatus Thiodiazotropha sp. (ex Epidulcina cf. delphinae)]|nr:hypothetical protein [Candidatus Thiodiazotropha sp. (ex Epidulcina cf. delphinae)]
MKTDLRKLGVLLYHTSPSLDHMKNCPVYQSWAEDLTSLSRHEELLPLQKVLTAMAEEALTTLEPFYRFLEEQAEDVPLEVYLKAGKVAEANLEYNPYSSFLLSWVSMLGWTTSLGAKLYDQRGGLPYNGWADIPYACALTGKAVGGLRIAREIVDHSYEMLQAANLKYLEMFKPAITRYRQLAGLINKKYEIAIQNLSEDIWISCHPDEPNFRAEFRAIVWSLGLVPECEALSTPQYVPSRRFVRFIVRQSLKYIPQDSLLQYLWLEMKDRPPINIREHISLFAEINFRYDQNLLDMMLPEPPSAVYAQMLINFFRGEVTENEARKYIDMWSGMYGAIKASVVNVERSVNIRMDLLCFLLAREFGMISGEGYEHQYLDWQKEMASYAIELNLLYPERLELGAKVNTALFYLLDSEFREYAKARPDSKASGFERVLEAIEEVRASSLSYWMRVAPPIPFKVEGRKAQSLLQNESNLLRGLRGAYFLMLYPILPLHFHRYVADQNVLNQRFEFSAKEGRRLYKELMSQLDALYDELDEVVPRYTEKRRKPMATLLDLSRAIRSHRESIPNNFDPTSPI